MRPLPRSSRAKLTTADIVTSATFFAGLSSFSPVSKVYGLLAIQDRISVKVIALGKVLESRSAFDQVTITEREMRLSMRTTVEAFREYAIALLASRSREFELTPSTGLAQEIDDRRSALPLKLFYAWLHDEMSNICVIECAATVQ